MGTVIDNRYEVLGHLGGGGGGEVHRVTDHVEGDEVALKIVDPNSLTPLGPWAEAQMLRRLVDHHILPIRNAYATAGYPLVVTEIAQEGTLADRLKAAPLGLDPTEAIRWMRQACLGIARAHEHGLVHNDIKPGNLFLNERLDCCVGDFGFAGAIDPTTGAAPVYGGTFLTMAPEVAATWPSSIATPLSDVYSLAATAFWALTGQPTHDISGLPTDLEQAAHVSSVRPPRVRDVAPHVPDAVARVINRALSHNPGDRPASAHDFGALLGRPDPGRLWRRTDEHPGHLACWRGAAAGTGGDYTLCMEQGAIAARRVLTARHGGSGNKITRGCGTATAASWPSVVRNLMRALG